jgi:hypothetical protein
VRRASKRKTLYLVIRARATGTRLIAADLAQNRPLICGEAVGGAEFRQLTEDQDGPRDGRGSLIEAFLDIVGRLEPGIARFEEPEERHDEILGALIVEEATPRRWRQRHRH